MKVVSEVRPARLVTKIGLIPMMGVYPWNSAPMLHPRSLDNRRPAPWATPNAKPRKLGEMLILQERRHSFAIENLPKGASFASRPYLYTCIRCKWTFRVNDRPGSIVTMDQNGQPLPEPENSGRIATFALGPCPALRNLAGRETTGVPRVGWFARTKDRVARQLLAMWRRWSGEDKHTVRVDPQATTAIMARDLIR